MAAHQQLTHSWWSDKRHEFELYVSQFVIRECRAGDPEMAEKRLNVLSGIKALDVLPETLDLARKLITSGPLPEKAETDAFHIAVAAANAMDYLLTWNCKHIANAAMKRGIDQLCRESGFEPPVLCTPEELLGEENYVEG